MDRGRGFPDAGRGQRQSWDPQGSQLDQGSARAGGRGTSWDLTGRGTLNRSAPQRPGNSAAPPSRLSPQFTPLPSRKYEDDNALETPPPRLSFAERDRAPPTVESRLNAHSEKERRRREHEYNEKVKLGKDKELQRQRTAQQVIKGVAKLSQIRKTRDIFLPKHVSVQHLSRLLGVKMGKAFI